MLCGQPVFGLAACDQPPPVNMPKLDSMEGPCEASDVAKPEMAIPAGIDMSLAFVARQNGEEAAKQVATYLEYSGDYRLQPLLHIPESDSRLCTEFLLKNPFRPLGVT